MPTEKNTTALRNLSALVDFSNLVNSSLDLNFTLNNLLLTCFTKFYTTKGIIAIINDDNKLVIEAYKGMKPDVIASFPDVPYNNFQDNTDLQKYIDENNLGVFERIVSSNGPRGIIILGKKINKEEYEPEDIEFLSTILNIGATAIENSLVFEKLRVVNRNLDSKVNQLSSLFDLSKEFSGILEVEMVSKMLVYSLLGQLLITKYAVVIFDSNDVSVLESKFPVEAIKSMFSDIDLDQFSKPVSDNSIEELYPELLSLGAKLIVPMIIKGKVKGLIILGERRNNLEYSVSDIEYISSVGGLAIISIENSRLFKEALEKQKLEKDLEIARKIQKNLLPKKIPTLEKFELAAYNQSARQVGGDYYDVVKLDDGRTLFAVGDVSGKGVQAALLMANLQAFLKSICKQDSTLEEASDLINDLVSENTTDGSFITFFWGILNEADSSLSSVNMGHNPPLLVRDGEIQKLKKGGMILGVMPTMIPYDSEKIDLKPGDYLVTFSDGVTEAMDRNEEEYTDERLEEFVLTLKGLSAKEILSKILEDVNKHTDGAEQSDDVTVLIVKVK